MKKLILICDVLLIAVLFYSAAFGSPFCRNDIYNNNEEYDEAWAICGADFNNNGLIDIAVVNTRAAEITHDSGRVTIYLNDSQDKGDFQLGSIYDVGPWARSVAAGHLDDDQNVDLAIACDSAVIVFWGDGDGTFDSHDCVLVGDGAKHLCVADLNDDDRLDIAVSNEDSGKVFVLMHDTTDQDFLTPDTYNVAGKPAQIIAVDVDSGQLDLVVGNMVETDSFAILLNDGGQFSVAYEELPYGAESKPQTLTSLYVNDDACADLAFARYLGDVLVLMNNCDSSGTFDTVTSKYTYQVGGEARRIIASDLDGDDDEELIVGNYDMDWFYILWNKGDSSFDVNKVDQDTIDNLWGCHAFYAGDLDGDAADLNDLAIGIKLTQTSNDKDLIILLNNLEISGDVDTTGTIDVSDVVYLVNYVFRQGPAPIETCCDDSGDVNCNGNTDVVDCVFLNNYVLLSGPKPCCCQEVE